MKISGKTKICGLIGDPIGHSLSPSIQNAAFQHLGLDYAYVVFKVIRENLKDAILGLRSLGFHGLNVTMPHKIDVIQYLDEIDETSKNVGSVNTILNNDGILVGYTTDGIGALKALIYNEVNPTGKKIVLLGAGGASRSISFTLAKEAGELVILNRTVGRAERLVSDLTSFLGKRKEVRAGPLNDKILKEELRDTDILVNATSIGMHPKETSTPVDASFLSSSLVVFDLVYKPIETRLLREARRIGAKTIDGLVLLVHQGAASFEIWTGRKAPIEVMMDAATEDLSNAR